MSMQSPAFFPLPLSLPEWAAPTAATLAPASLAGLCPPAAGVPEAIWAAVLVDPVFELLCRPGKAFRARLTTLGFRLAGRSETPPAELVALVELIHAGSLVVDDIEDGSDSRRGRPALHRMYDPALALNVGNWLYFHPLDLVPRLGLAPEAELALFRRCHRVLVDSHYGQALDLGVRLGGVPRPRVGDVVLTTSLLKTGRLMSLAAAGGALCGGAGPELVEPLARFGEALGVGLQMLDDLGNLEGKKDPRKRLEDLRGARLGWPWAWAAELLDETGYRRLERQALQAVASADDDRLAEVAQALTFTVAAHARAATQTRLTGALDELRRALPASPQVEAALAALAAEMKRVEVSYG